MKILLTGGAGYIGSHAAIALLEGDNASQNRLSISIKFDIFILKPEEDLMTMTSTRFIDYDSNTDLGIVENQLLEVPLKMKEFLSI